MTITLVIPDRIGSKLHQLANDDLETGGVILARPVHTANGDLRLLVRTLHEVPNDAYDKREAQQLLIRSEGYVPSLAEAADTECVPIWFHTHPGSDGIPMASRHDIKVDQQLSDLFRLRSDSEYYGSLIVSPGINLRFTGHIDDGNKVSQIDRLMIVGARLSIQMNDDSEQKELPQLLDRNIRAFGGDVQRVLSNLRVAVVGCGGTGSVVSEQLVRLGVRTVTLIDPDTLSLSNVTRVYGSGDQKVGGLKVDVLADHLEQIASDVIVNRIVGKITTESVAKQLLSADVIFGCTDDNAGRLVLSRFATYMLTPVIDCGVLLTSNASGQLDGIDGRVTVMHPGAACLVCRERVDLARAVSETLTSEELELRVHEGYAPALGDIEPAVVTFTTMVGAMAVSELLERLTGYGIVPVPNEVLLRLHDRELSTNSQIPRSHHYCDQTSGKWGLGMTDLFLEQTWQM